MNNPPADKPQMPTSFGEGGYDRNARDYELKLKHAEFVQKQYEPLGDYLKEVRAIGVALGSMVLAIAGGALTLSIGQFLRNDAPKLTTANLHWLHGAWFSLFGSIAGVFAWGFTLVIVMSVHGRRWRRALGDSKLPFKQPFLGEIFGWTFAVETLAALLVGLGILALLTSHLPNP